MFGVSRGGGGGRSIVMHASGGHFDNYINGLRFSGNGEYTLYSDNTVELKGQNLAINGVPVDPGTYKKGDNTSWVPVEASCIACGMLALACSVCQEPLYCSHECASDASWQDHILKSHPL